MSATTSENTAAVAAVRGRAVALVGSLTFLVAYLLVAPVAGALSNADIPQPDDAASVLVDYYSDNAAAAYAGAWLQALSVLGFAAFAFAVVRTLRSAGTVVGRRLSGIALVSVIAMLVSSALTTALPLVVADVEPETVGALRDASFYAGGVANVVTLGIFAWLASRELAGHHLVGRKTKVLGTIAGVLCALSVLSLAVYVANLFLPLGRLLAMVWTVVAAVGLWRAARR